MMNRSYAKITSSTLSDKIQSRIAAIFEKQANNGNRFAPKATLQTALPQIDNAKIKTPSEPET
jgi:hypothetical protein